MQESAQHQYRTHGEERKQGGRARERRIRGRSGTVKKIEIGELKEGCADNCGLIDLNAIRFPNEIASVRFCADFEITEQEENDERSE